MRKLVDSYHVYIVRCRNGALYTGTARKVKDRLLQHNSGKGAKYTRAFGPVELVWSKRYGSRSQACRVESQIKKLTRSQKQGIIKGRLVLGRKLGSVIDR